MRDWWQIGTWEFGKRGSWQWLHGWLHLLKHTHNCTLKVHQTLQPCRIRSLFNFSSPRACNSRLHPFSPQYFIFCYFCFSLSWPEDSRKFGNEFPKMGGTSIEEGDIARPPNRSDLSRCCMQPLEGREAGSWETHHSAGSPGRNHGPATLKCCRGSYCLNCQLQPWSTAPFP